VAVHDEQINELTEQIQAARDALDLETVAELEAQRDQLIDQKNLENSAAGQLAESTLDEVPAPNTAEQELTDEEVNKINSSGGGSSGLNLTPIAALVGAAAIDQAIKKSKAGSEADEDETPAADNTQEVGEDTTDAAESQNQASEAPVEVNAPVDLRSNILHNYDSYTYRISLYALSKDDYNSMTKNPKSFVPKHLLIQSGGGVGLTGSRHRDFEEDFYFGDLDILTIPGLNAQTKASNAIQISFEIIEPIGLTLLDRLMSVCRDIDNCNNYVEQPYLIEIDFIPANGNGPIEKAKKRLPIRIMGLNISPGPQGTTYKCTAIPFNHSAFSESVAKLPVAINVTATTLKDFFSAEPLETNFISDLQERIESASAQLKQNTQFLVPNQNALAPLLNKIASTTIGEATSYPGAYNQFFTEQAGKNYKLSNPQIKFQFDEEFINSKIVRDKNTDASTTPMGEQGENHTPGSPDKTKQGFVIPAGIDVVEVIDRVMRKSDYIVKQLDEQVSKVASSTGGFNQLSGLIANATSTNATSRDADKKQSKYLNWFKIIPQVQLLNFDGGSNSYGKVVTYFIQKYRAANARHPSFARTKVSKGNIVRSYQYLYTGKNTDIINFDIDFNAVYYTAVTAFARSKIKNNTRFESDDLGLEPKDNRYPGDPNNRNKDGDPTEMYKSRGVNPAGGQLNRTAEENKQAMVDDLVESIYTNAAGDLLNCKLTIIGDPALIKQDDNYYTPASNEWNAFSKGITDGDKLPIDPDSGQIIYDNKQVYIQIYFDQFPTDIDDNTGITNKKLQLSGGNINSSFSGIYKIVRVENKFSNGRFTQVLDTVRMPGSFTKEDLDLAQEPAQSYSSDIESAGGAVTQGGGYSQGLQ